MNQENVYHGYAVAQAPAQERIAFIRRTYLHLGGAIVAFAALEALLFQMGVPAVMMNLLGTSQYSWLIVLAAFMGVSWLANRWAQSDTSIQMQYAGLGLYVAAQAVIFVPLLAVAASISGSEMIMSAALLTLVLFTGLTVVAFTSGKDFSFLGGILKIGCFIALGVVAASIIFGFTLGVIFSAVMIAVAAGAILYDTSNVMHRYRVTQHVAASLALFASVALLFWYVLRLLMGISRRD